MHKIRRSLALPVLLFTAGASAQQPPILKSSISIVEIDAAVIGKGGPIDGLQLSDFAVTDNRQPVMLHDGSQEDSALDIVFLFELSKPMLSKLEQIRVAAEMAMAELREGDRVAVMSFNQTAQLEQPLTADLKAAKLRIRNGLAGARFASAPYIVPGADSSAKYLLAQPEPHGRRVVLMFTGDAGLNPGTLDSAAVTKHLWEADASLSAMVFPNYLTRLTHDTNPAHFGILTGLGLKLFDVVDGVAVDTGGEVIYTERAGSIGASPTPNAALRQVIQRMRHRYRLYYDMPPGRPGQSRKIQIELSPATQALHPDAWIIGRKGYVIPKHAP